MTSIQAKRAKAAQDGSFNGNPCQYCIFTVQTEADLRDMCRFAARDEFKHLDGDKETYHLKCHTCHARKNGHCLQVPSELHADVDKANKLRDIAISPTAGVVAVQEALKAYGNINASINYLYPALNGSEGLHLHQGTADWNFSGPFALLRDRSNRNKRQSPFSGNDGAISSTPTRRKTTLMPSRAGVDGEIDYKKRSEDLSSRLAAVSSVLNDVVDAVDTAPKTKLSVALKDLLTLRPTCNDVRGIAGPTYPSTGD